MNQRPPPEDRRDAWCALAFVMLATFAYTFAMHSRGLTGDTRPAELLPLAFTRNHNLTFDGFPATPADYWFETIDGHVISRYPIVPGLLHLVSYTIATMVGFAFDAKNITRLSQITAAILTALSVAPFYLAVRQLVRTRIAAIAGTTLFAFGTTAFSVAARALWQHGPALLFLNLTLWLLASRATTARLFLAGVTSGLLFWNRPLLAVIIAPLAVVVLFRERWRAGTYAAGAFVSLALMAWYTFTYWKAPGLGQADSFHGFIGNPMEGFPGLLVSPNRGLFVFTPAFLLSIVPLAAALRHPRKQPLLTALAVGSVLLVLVCSFWFSWWGGHSHAYRLLTELAPALALFFAIAWERLRGSASRVAALGLVAASIYIHALLAYVGPCGFNATPNDIDEHPERLWSMRDTELERCQSQLLRKLTK